MSVDRMPDVSIITPSFNSGRFISAAIDSVQSQTHKDWELIIVDDCSTDDTRSIVSQRLLTDKRIRMIRQTSNQGPAIARNTALDAARGRYIAFLDSDDLWLSRKLEIQLSFMREDNIAFSCTQYRHLSEDGSVCGSLISPLTYFDYGRLLKNTNIGCLTVMLDRNMVGDFKFDNYYREDYILWLRLLKRGFRAHGIQEDLARYRIVKKSDSRNKMKASSGVWRVYRNVEKLSFPYAIWCFMHYAWNGYGKNKSLRTSGL